METISYHSFHDKLQKTLFACNRASDTLPLLVNCAGATVCKWAFQTVNPSGRQDYYFLYLKKGSLHVTVDGESRTVDDGTLILIPPQSAYAYRHDNEQELTYYWVHFTGSSVLDVLKQLQLSQLPLLLSAPQISSAIEYQMAKMFDIYIKKGDFRDSELSHCLDAMLIEAAKNANATRAAHRRLSASIKHINNHYTEEITVPTLAEMESLSVSRYIALFREIMHTSPYQYIIDLRLNAACEMLLNSSLSITSISEILGFQSVFFFSKLFKKHLGVSPMQYRKSALS